MIFDDNINATIIAVFFINIKRFEIKFLFVVLGLKRSISRHKQKQILKNKIQFDWRSLDCDLLKGMKKVL